MNHEAKADLARLLLRCPERRRALRLMASTPTMADICESYEQVWQAALYWAGVPGREAAEVAADFRRLITTLEEEALSITELRVQRQA